VRVGNPKNENGWDGDVWRLSKDGSVCIDATIGVR
jgi:hypothetical protein